MRWTVVSVLVLLAVAAMLLARVAESQRCADDDGHYVQTLTGWECIR